MKAVSTPASTFVSALDVAINARLELQQARRVRKVFKRANAAVGGMARRDSMLLAAIGLLEFPASVNTGTRTMLPCSPRCYVTKPLHSPSRWSPCYLTRATPSRDHQV